ncbi:lysosome-associated membrane glycoprotein 2 isoform X2 [Hoplias malabaricus]|uniref:lysosome-associated membrane glycoprotein 2 isoform X2 n=1 Tax=Hoplias malabaricus TaxID=27720 RepID=UPI0034627274
MAPSLVFTVFFLLTSGFVCADVFLSYPESYVWPASTAMEDRDSSTTKGLFDSVTDYSDSSEPTETVPSSTAETSTTVSTTAPTTQTSNGTTVAPTTQQTNATTPPPTTHVTNATTSPPTTHTTNGTTASTTEPTNTTSVVPTNSTTPFIPTTSVPTTPTPPSPSVGDYRVYAGPNSVCLKANMGLQFRFKEEAIFQTINLEPNVTNANGSCGSNGTDSTLILRSENITVQFVFSNQSNKFHLSTLNFTLQNADGSIFSSWNSNLSLWEASLGSSYMCRKEQTFNISNNLILNTFDLQVQPFGVSEDKFSTAHECSMDDTSLLIPIIVGAALAGLILIVVIAYMIGRRKTYVGYQTL